MLEAACVMNPGFESFNKDTFQGDAAPKSDPSAGLNLISPAKAKEYFPNPIFPRYLVIIITKKKDAILSNISVLNRNPVFLTIVLADDILF